MVRRVWLTVSVLVMAILVIATGPTPAYAVGIQGTMSNFDVFNETNQNVYGAELDLEGIHSTDVSKTYPSHFNIMTATEYVNGAVFGTHLTFKEYNFDPSGYMIPRTGQSTNGHFAVNLPGCEHFGFSVTTQPTATRFFWLGQGYNQIGTTPLSIPNPTWTYVPAAIPGNPAVVQAVVQAPAPEIPEALLPDSIWMKVYITELERAVDLEELMSGPGSVAPQDQAEIETEWVLLEGGVAEVDNAPVGANAEAVIRRYEYFKYTGDYTAEHGPNSQGLDPFGQPYGNELGDFIAANMVAVNLVPVPEPSSILAMLVALGGFAGIAWRRRK